MMSNDVVIDIVKDKSTGGHRALLPEARVRSANATSQRSSQTDYPGDDVSSKDWAPWGKKDRFPTDVRCKIEKVPLAGQAIHKLAAMIYGNGLKYYRTEDLFNQDAEVEPVYRPEIQEWLWRNRIHKWAMGQITDFRQLMNCFSEIVFRNDKRYISRIYHKQAEFCRLEKQNENTLRKEKLYYSPYFADNRSPKEDQIAEIPLYNWEEDEEEFFDRHRGHTLAYHTHFPTPGMKYYARPLWVGLYRNSGWLDVSANVPEIVHAMGKNQMLLKYQVIIPEDYFNHRHDQWDTYSAEKKESIYDKKVEEINDYLTDTKNAYKSLCQMVKTDPTYESRSGGPMPLDQIKIIAVDDKTKEGAWIPDSQAADSQIVQGLGIHPSQMGLQPEGGKMGAGSGSDQRESFNTQISLNTADQHVILEPLNFISRFNNWGVTFLFDNTRHVTLDKNRTGFENQSPPVQ